MKDSSSSFWPELLTDPSGRLTDKRRVYIVSENGNTDIPENHFFVRGQFQMYPWADGDDDIVRVSRRKSSWKFQAGRYIGLIPLNDCVMLDVRPRVPLANLSRIMRIAEGKPRELEGFLSHYTERPESLPSMLDFFARALTDRVTEIAFDGLYREYVEKAEGTAFPHGRLLPGETMRRYSTRGVGHHVAATWYEQTVDTAPNRCLKYALWFLAAHYNWMNKKNDLLARIERSYHIFAGVELDTSRHFLKSPTIIDPETLPSIRAYYKPAINLALLILQNKGISFMDRGGKVMLRSLLINLQTIFENYSRNILRERLRDLENEVQVLDGRVKAGQKHLFDEPLDSKQKSQPATPDIVFKRAAASVEDSNGTLLVAEVKYIDSVEPKRTDINQAGMYALSYRAPVVIVHPRVEEKTHGMYPLPLLAPVTIYHYAFDLAAKDPDAEEEMFAKSFRALLQV